MIKLFRDWPSPRFSRQSPAYGGVGLGCTCCRPYYYYTIPKVPCTQCSGGVSRTLHVSIFNNGLCPGITGSAATLIYDSTLGYWSGFASGSFVVKVYVRCSPFTGLMQYTYHSSPNCDIANSNDPPQPDTWSNLTSVNCSPFSASGSGTVNCLVAGVYVCRFIGFTFSE